MMPPTSAVRRPASRHAESGIALVLVLLFMLAVSAIGASMTVLARTESYASMNYRMMSQTRYGAESGVHRAVNYLLNSYTLPGGVGDPLSNYNMTVTPVTYNNQPVVLSSIAGVTANYPSTAVSNAFAAAVQGALPVGGANVQYTASATLLSMRPLTPYGTFTATVAQTWRITGDGSLTGVRNATVEVMAVLEREVVPAHTYAAFATNPSCGALSFSGGVLTNSYDSSAIMWVNDPATPATQANTGNVGTNGNLTEGGGSVVNGSLSTPRTGVGNCANGAVDALTSNGNAQLLGGIVPLPQAVTYVPPAAPNPAALESTMTIGPNATCATASMPAANCAGTGGVLTLTPTTGPVLLGDVRLSGGSTLRLTAGTYNVNSLTLAGSSYLMIDSGPVIMNIQGKNQPTPLDLKGGTTSNASFIPSNFQIQYAGTGELKLAGGTSASAMVYAPLATVSLFGGSNFYGSLLGAFVTNLGGTAMHYDRHLNSTFSTAGNYMLTSFTWKKF